MKKIISVLMILLSIICVCCSCGEKEITEADLREMKETVDESVSQLEENVKKIDRMKEGYLD